jgi:hypothetical protein
VDTDTEDTDTEDTGTEDTGTPVDEEKTYSLATKTTNNEIISNSDVLANVFKAEKDGTIKEFSFLFTSPGTNCEATLGLLSRTSAPTSQTSGTWSIEWESKTRLVNAYTSSGKLPSGTMDQAIESGKYYALAVSVNECVSNSGIRFGSNTSSTKGVDIGVGNTIGFIGPTHFMNLVFDSSYTSHFPMKLTVTIETSTQPN